MKYFFCLILITAIPLLSNCSSGDNQSEQPFSVTPINPVAVQKTNSMKVYAHYMPWFETKETSADGKWGWHWTMENKNPDIIVDEKRQIASWYYPSIGPYASSDPDVLEYHLLLMKYSGIDGVLVDWYGLTNSSDLPAINRNAEALFKAIEQTGLEFAFVYEDRFLQGDREAQIYQAQQDIRHLQNNYFNKDYYIKVNGKPLLLIFGPITLQAEADWTRVFSIINNNPVFLTLYEHAHLAGTNANGEYMWVFENHTPDEQYNKKDNFSIFFGGAYPGFRDYYEQGGGGSHLFDIDYENGNLYKNILNMAKQKNVNFLQLITWNDFGEGTMIEPTLEFGYDFLKSTQTFTGVNYAENQLTLIRKLFDYRKEFKTDKEINKKLDQIFYYLVSLQVDKATELIQTIK
ncbi:MAG: hypothetical protein LBC68_01220 [Prevotellaceae bacterium]|jgi:hypothetical protein|nr:hypothetical protein [Prevotellaceae bacterium]